MKITIDCDGVLVQFMEHFHFWIHENYPEVKVDTTSYELISDKKLQGRLIHEFWDSGELYELEFFPHATEIITNLSKHHELYITTALDPMYKLDRLENLKRLEGLYKEMYFKPYIKGEFIIEELKPDIAIEDKPKLIRQMAQAGIKVFFPVTEYTCVDDLYEVATGYKNWRELGKMMEKYGIENRGK